MKFLRCYVIFSFLVFVSNVTFGQVSLQTGAAEFNLPLFKYGDPNSGLNYDLSLNYISGGGLRVADIPSSVGTGWSLECGGIIERIQLGERDDQKNNDTYAFPNCIGNLSEELVYKNWVENYFPNGYIYSEFSSTTPTTNGAAAFPFVPNSCYVFKNRQQYQADKEQDMFRFSFGGRSGIFIISKPVSGAVTIRTLVDSRLKISVVFGDLNNNQNIRTTITEFHIVDEFGIKYIFKDADITELCSYDRTYYYHANGEKYIQSGNHAFAFCPLSVPVVGQGGVYEISGLSLGVVRGTPKGKFFKDKWHLTKIINPATNKAITLEYEDYAYDMEWQTISNAATTTYDGNLKTNMSIMLVRSKGVAKRLKKVVLSPDESLEMQYDAGFRSDLAFDKKLNSIKVKYKDQLMYEWEFSHGYFVKNQIKASNAALSNEEKRWARLCLQSIQKKGRDNVKENPYSFQYYMGNEGGVNSAVPPIFAYYHDGWGFYNATITGYFNPANQSQGGANPPYEPYDGNVHSKALYVNMSTNQQIMKAPTVEARNGVLKTITYPAGGQLTYEFEQNRGSSNQPVGGIRVKKLIVYDGIDHQKDIVKEYSYLTEAGASSAWGNESLIYSYVDETDYLNNPDKRSVISPVSLAVGLQQAMNGPRGLPHYYLYALKHKIDIPSGPGSLLNYLGGQLVQAIVYWVLSLINQPQTHFVTTHYSSETVNGTNLLPYQYGRTVVQEKNGPEALGKTIFEFTTNVDYPVEVPTLTLPYSAKPRVAPWQYGLIKRIVYKDKNDATVKKTENVYNSTKVYLNNASNASYKWTIKNRMIVNGFFGCNGLQLPFPPDNGTSTFLHTDSYYPLTGRAELLSSTDFIYNASGSSTTQTTTYQYNPLNFMIRKTETTNSKGELIESYTYYPDDYTLPGAIQTMKQNNIVNVPISSQSMITKPGNQKYVFEGSILEFTTLPNSETKLSKRYSFSNDMPVLASSIPFNPAVLNINPTYYKETGTTFYDAGGIPVQINSPQGKVSTIYDYGGKVIVATATNANKDDIAFTSFETESTGNWNYAPGYNLRTDKFLTGYRSFTGTLTKTMVNVGNYTVMVWVHTSGNVSVNSTTGTLLATVGDWKLYEWKLTGVNNITVTGDIIDEVRLHPSNAKMTTVTYDPLCGKTAETDVANRITYYEYDGLGRLRTIRDENRNVIKTYEYNFKQ